LGEVLRLPEESRRRRRFQKYRRGPGVKPAEAAKTAKPAKTARPGSRAEVGVYPRVAKLVVAAFLGVVGEDFVGLVDLFELRLGLLASGVDVGMEFFCELAVGLFDLLGGSPLGDP
jgi:hypothetical protein